MSKEPSSLDHPSPGAQLALWLLLAAFLISIIAFGWFSQNPSTQATAEGPELTYEQLSKLDRTWHLLGAADAERVEDLTENTAYLTEARTLLDDLEHQIPDHRRVLFYRGLERLVSKDLSASKGALEKAVRASANTESETLPLLLTLSAVLTDLKDYAGAERALRQALDIAPDSPSVWGNLGQVLWLLDRKDESLAAYRKKLELEGIPTLPEGPV